MEIFNAAFTAPRLEGSLTAGRFLSLARTLKDTNALAMCYSLKLSSRLRW